MDFLVQSPQISGDGKSCLITNLDKEPLIFQVSNNLRKPCKIVNSKISKNKIVCALEIPPSACRYFESLDSKIVKFLSSKSSDFFGRKLSSKDIKDMLIPSVIDKCIQTKIRPNVEIFEDKSVVPRKEEDLEKTNQYLMTKSLIPRICIEGVYFWSKSCQVIMSAESIMTVEKQKPQFIFEKETDEIDENIVTPFPQMISTTICTQRNETENEQDVEEIDHIASKKEEELSGLGCNFLTIVEEEVENDDDE